MITIQQDTREQTKKHDHVLKYFAAEGIKVVRSKLYVGDYTRLDKQDVCIDTKKDLQEVYGNVILHNVRFKEECIRAKEAGIRLVVLIADEHIRHISEVHTWVNPRIRKWETVKAAQEKGKLMQIKLSPRPPVSSEQLQRAMETMGERYGVEWRFCPKAETGRRILEILGVKEVKAWQTEVHL